MPCNEGLRLQEYFDGELGPQEAVALERHLETCPDCTAELADLQALRRALREQAPYHRASQELRRGLEAKLDRLDGRAKPGRKPFFGRPFLAGALSGAAFAALAALLAFLVILPSPDTDELVDDVVNAHLRSMMSDHLIDVASSDRHTVKPWFAGHTDVSPPAGNFAQAGYTLIGGRADYVYGHRAAVVVYRHGKHVIDVFAWAYDGEKLPGTAEHNGYHAVFWTVGDLAYCAVSDTGLSELEALVRLVTQAAAAENRE